MSEYSGAPVFFDHANASMSLNRPGTVKCQNTALFWYFRRRLLQKAISVFTWNLPQTWSRDYFLYVLYCWGFIAVVNTDRFGVIPQGCGLQGYNVFYQPRRAIIVNPLIKGIKNPLIGEECVLLKLQPDFGGVMDTVNYYAEAMALASEAVSVNLLNSKFSYVFAAGSKAGAESLKALYDEYASGQPAVFFDKKLLTDEGKLSWQLFSQDIKQSYIVNDLLTDMRKLEADFDTCIGIPNSNTDRRDNTAYANKDAINANNVETVSRAAMWLQSLKQGCEEVKDMFGVEMSVDWRFKPEEVQNVAAS